MPGEIRKDWLINPTAVQDVLNELNKIPEEIRRIKAEIKKMAITQEDIFKGIKISGTGVQQLNEVASTTKRLETYFRSLTEQEKANNAVTNQLEKSIAKLRAQRSLESKQLLVVKQAHKDLINQQKQELGLINKRKGLFTGIIRQVKGLAAAYLGLYGILRLVNSIFTTTKQLEQLRFSLRTVIEDTYELASTQAYLSRTAKNLGIDLIKISELYTRFRATTKETNITLDQTKDVFETVAKAGAVLGLSSQRIELALLALEQMASKGTVSMEELRRQLGDQIPGAVIIMARAMNKTIPELYKMIRANELLSEEALPKFAEELRNAFSLDNITRVNTLAAAQGRLKVSWQELVEAIQASGAIQSTLEGITHIFDNLNKKIRITNDAFLYSDELLETYFKYLKNINEEFSREAVITDISNEIIKYNKIYLSLLEDITKKEKELGEWQDITHRKDNIRIKKELENLRMLAKSYLNAKTNLEDLINNKERLDELFIEPPDITAEDKKIKKLREELESATGIIEKLEAERKLKQYLLILAKDNKSIRKLNLEIQELENLIKKYRNLGIEVKKNREKFIKWDEVIDKILKKYNKKFFDDEFNLILKDQYDFEKKLRDNRIQEQIDYLTEIGKLDQNAHEHRLNILNGFYKDGLIDQEEYERESLRLWLDYNPLLEKYGFANKEIYELNLKEVKSLLTQGLITEEEYHIKVVQLWLRYNEQKIQLAEQFAESILDILNNLNDGEISLLEKEIDKRDDNLSDLRDKLQEEQRLKDEGKANDVQRLESQIEEEQRLREKAATELEKAQKREAQIQLAQQSASIITATAKLIEGWEAINPLFGWLIGLAQATAMIAAFTSYKSKIKAIGKYAKGEEDIKGPGTETSDSIPSMLSKHERVVPADINKKLDGIPNDKLPEAVSLWKLNFEHDLSRSNYQRHSSFSELLNEYREHKNISQKLLNAVTGKKDIIPMEHSDNEITFMIISNNGNNIEIKRKQK